MSGAAFGTGLSDVSKTDSTNIDAQSTKLTFNPNPPLLPNIFCLILIIEILPDMQLIPLEIIHSSRDSIRKARESFLID